MSSSSSIVRSFEDELAFIKQSGEVQYNIAKGFVPNMRVEGTFYVNDSLKEILWEELDHFSTSKGIGGFLPAVKQIANVAALPGIVKKSIGLPDVHSGYGFSIGNVAAFDMNDPTAIVSPGGVGFDINCGVRLLRTNLFEEDLKGCKEELTQALFDHIPVGVGSKGIIPTNASDLEDALEMGMDWSLREGYAWAEDKEHCFSPDTQVLLANGLRRAIGDCAVGDRLVDETGAARTIVSKSTGRGQLFNVTYSNMGVITTENAASFTCNEGHQLVIHFGYGAFVQALEEHDRVVHATDSPQIAKYCVNYHRILPDAALGFDVPVNCSMTFNVDSGGRAAAEAFAATITPHLLWQPTVGQYLAYISRYPNCEQWCHMMRAAPDDLPDPSPHPRFRDILSTAYDAVEAAGGVPVLPAQRISPADAAYLIGLWLGDGHKARACIYLQKPEAGGEDSPLDTLLEAAPKMDGLETQFFPSDLALAPPGTGGAAVPSPSSSSSATQPFADRPLLHDQPGKNLFVHLLTLLGMLLGEVIDKPISVAAEQAFLRDEVKVRASLVAGLLDSTDGERRGAGWIFHQKDVPDDKTSEQFHLSIAELVYRAALSIGFSASFSHNIKSTTTRLAGVEESKQAVVCITAPAGVTDILSPLIHHSSKRVPLAEPCDATTEGRWIRGEQPYRFTIAPTTVGPYISVQVDGPNHRFLLADYLVVHNCEEYGRMLSADPSKVSKRAKKRGLPQLGTLGAGNHYAEIQVVEKIYDKQAAARMGIEDEGQVCVMIHSGSRGLGHQVATDALVEMENAMARDKIAVNDRQLACALISSKEGQDYLAAMAAAANYAWVNRSSMTFLARQAFSKIFSSSPDDLDMHVIYDVSHNIAKVEEHIVDGRPRKLLVHRKGATRAFGPHHPLIPVDYQFTGQPVLIGGTMGTASYVLTGTDVGMEETFGSTCHGAGRASSRAKSRRTLTYEGVLGALAERGISIRVASPKLVMEEAPESYKDVTAVVDTCHKAGISNTAIKLRPVAVVKG